MSWTITQIASVVLCAMGMGLIFSCLGHTPVLGYIIAGLLLGPSVFSVINDYESVTLFSEMGIIFLFFFIGQGLSFEKIKHIWKSSILLTIASMFCTYIILFIIGYILQIPQTKIILFTFCITLSSTAVTIKSLKTLKEKEDSIEENIFGILIAQDLISLVMVLVINAMAKNGDFAVSYKSTRLIALLLFTTGLFLYFFYYHKYVHKITNFIRKHDEMQSIIIFGICLGGAVLAELVGFSAPFGAFIAGLIIGNSNLKDEAKAVSLPIEEILLMIFFLSVGLLVDLQFVWNNLGFIFLALIYVTVGKTFLNIFLLRIFKFPLKDSFIIGVLLGHIGEFSFMLAFAASKVGIIGVTELKFLISITAISLFMSPFWLIFAERCRKLAISSINLSSWEFFSLVVARETHKTNIMIKFILRITKISLNFLYKKAKILFVLLRNKLKR